MSLSELPLRGTLIFPNFLTIFSVVSYSKPSLLRYWNCWSA
jgi:hypothetical protein